jgi:hypothetical protein
LFALASLPCFLLAALVLTACNGGATPISASNDLVAGDCLSVVRIGIDDAAPVRKVPCAPAGTVISNSDTYSVYRVVYAITLAVPVTSRGGADDLARLYCRSAEVTPGSSLYVFPTEASFAEGFKQFLCLSH